MISGKRVIASYAILMILMILLREYWLFMRQGLHVDESMSFILSAYNPYGFDKAFPDVLKLTGDQLRAAMWFNDVTISGMLGDIKSLWVFNRDTPHSNLYYSLLRIWFTGTSSDKFYFTLLWAVQLNIVLSVASMLIFSHMAYQLSRSHLVTISSVIVAFICYETISNTIFARPYQLQETMTLAFLSMTMAYMRNVLPSTKFIICYSIVTAFTLLTGYFSVVYVFIVMLMVLIYAMFNCDKNYKDLALTCLKFSLTTSIVAYAIYPPYFFVGGSRQNEALSKSDSLHENMLKAVNTLHDLGTYHPHFWFAFGAFIICVVASFLWKKADMNKPFILIAISSTIIWWLFVMTFAPYKVPRYVYPALPVLAFVYTTVMIVAGRIHKELGIAVCVVVVSLSIVTYKAGKVDYSFSNNKPYCNVALSGETIYFISAPYRLNGLTDCLPDKKVTIVSNQDQFDKEMSKSGFNHIVSDKPLNGFTKVDSYGYFTVYRAR